jgi:deoxyribonuclease-4
MKSNTKMSDRTRVRSILSALTATERADLKKLLPKVKMPTTEAIRYPNALLTVFQKEECYSMLGCVAESLLRVSPDMVTVDTVCEAAKGMDPTLTEAALNKIRVSKTTQPFIDHIVATRRKIDAITRGATLRYDEVVSFDAIEGHPDGRTDTQIFEVKLTGQMKENWMSFLYQVFAYGALAPEATDLFLVFPLQELIWHANIREWEGRVAYRDFLNAAAKKKSANAVLDAVRGALIRETYDIGFHAAKQKSLVTTIQGLAAAGTSKPYQIFLGSTQSSHMNIKDEELAAAAKAIQTTGLKLFVHSQYIINLCADPSIQDGYHTALLIKNLNYARAIGCRGVVVHVGKSTDKPLPQALTNMRTNLLAAMEHASLECPILLETPAGQGTETLTKYEEFVEFVRDFADARIRICIDTCHVFACGSEPIDYIQKLSTEVNMVKLIHYNDSATPCGSCVDRHAYMGTGYIGFDKMETIAKFCHGRTYPMLIE